MYKIYKNYLITSDWHLLHKNIFKYEFNARKKFFRSNIKIEDVSNFTVFDIELSNELFLKEFLEKIKNENLDGITEYLNLGDFIFELTENKVENIKKSKVFKLLKEIKKEFNSKNIKCYLILGNHDFKNFENENINNFYKEIFDEVFLYKFELGDLFIHHPLGASLSKYPLKGDFFIIDQELLEFSKNNNIICHHGHIHSKELEGGLDGIKYINYSLDKLI